MTRIGEVGRIQGRLSSITHWAEARPSSFVNRSGIERLWNRVLRCGANTTYSEPVTKSLHSLQRWQVRGVPNHVLLVFERRTYGSSKVPAR